MMRSHTLFLLMSALCLYAVSSYPNIHSFEKFTEADAVTTNSESPFNTDWFNQWVNGARDNRESGLFNYFFQNEHKENDEERLSKLQPPSEAYNYHVDFVEYPNNGPNHEREHGPNYHHLSGQHQNSYNQIQYNKLLQRLKGPQNDTGSNLPHQSPIDIQNKELISRTYRSKLKWHFYGEEPKEMFVENTGHTAQVTATFPLGRRPSISNGPLNSTYLLQQIHFHWGSSDKEGSEHTVDGHRFPLEMHVVHYNRKYKTFENSIGKPDGLAVVGFMGELISSGRNLWPNKGIRIITSELDGLKPGAKKPLRTKFTLDSLLVPFYRDYITYDGSLTTPAYNEGVTWLISSYALSITKTDVKQFRNMEKPNGEGKIEENWRQVQPLNGRDVYIVE